MPTLGAELVLWHKGRGEIRERDKQDFAAVVPLLDEPQRKWLSSSLRAIDPGHPWIPEI